jgi:hypothetical protein
MSTSQLHSYIYTELQFIAIVSEVKEYSGILSAKSILSRLPVIPTVVIYQWIKLGE